MLKKYFTLSIQTLKSEKIRRLIKESWAVSWPMMFIMTFEFLIGLSDVYVAGIFGQEVQAAYGLAFQIYFVFIIIGIALSIGSVTLVSQLFTSEKKEEFSLCVQTSIAASACFGAVFTVLGVTFSRSIIQSLNIPIEIKNYATPLLSIYSLAFVFDYVLLTTNGILRSCGMIRKSLQTMAISCSLNIALNFILALATPLGFKGIGWATVISLTLGAVLNIFYIMKLVKLAFRFSVAIVKKIFDISWPSGLVQILWQSGAMVLFLIIGILPKQNVEIMAAFTNGLKIESAIFLPGFAFNMAAAVVVGNLLGKKDERGAFRGGIITAFIGVFIVTCLTILIMINARFIASFLSDNPVVIEESVKYIYIALLVEPIAAWGIILSGGLNGAGDTKSVMIFTAVSIWLVRLPLSYIWGIYFGSGAAAIWWAMNVSAIVMVGLMTKRYFSKKWINLDIGINCADFT